MAHYYLELENSVDLAIVDVNFPVDHADYFFVTVMNPSHSPSGTNITEIYLTVEDDENLYNVKNTYPEELPIPLERGTSKNIKCTIDWGNFSGKTITVHVSALNASGASSSFRTEFVKLEVEAYFNATESINYFNVSVKNNVSSAINLTLTEVSIDYEPIEDMSIELPRNISIGETIDFQCFFNWRGYSKPLVKIETLEGYSAEIRKELRSVVVLQVMNVTFNEANPDANEINITFFNSEESAAPVDITNIVLQYDNVTEYNITETLANPSLPYRLEKNNTTTFKCTWIWKDYRDKNIVITAYTKQGFVSTPITVKTPPEVVAKITDVKFDLDDTEQFFVNVTNMPCSLYEINVTKIEFNQNSTVTDSSIIVIDGQSSFTCGFNWTGFLGKNVTITVNILYNVSETSSIPYNLTLPYIKIRAVAFSNFEHGNPYVNITIYNSVFSTTNATITRMFIETENGTLPIDGTLTNPKISPQGYELTIGTEITIVCPWDWSPYVGKDVTVIVETADGLKATKMLTVS